MSQAGDLLAQAQTFHAENFPGTITIAGQSYDCATTGLRREAELGDGGFTAKRSVTFWLPASAFTDAGQPMPVEQKSSVLCTAPASHAGRYLIESLSPDGTSATLILRCSAPAQ